MRRACSPFEAWGAWPRSRFAARSANCLKKRPTRCELGERKKNRFVWQVACANGCGKFISRIWWRLLHETDDGRLMKMQARYTGPLKAARPPLSTTLRSSEYPPRGARGGYLGVSGINSEAVCACSVLLLARQGASCPISLSSPQVSFHKSVCGTVARSTGQELPRIEHLPCPPHETSA